MYIIYMKALCRRPIKALLLVASTSSAPTSVCGLELLVSLAGLKVRVSVALSY